MKKHIFLAAIAAMTLVSCSSSDDSKTNENAEQIAINLTSNVLGQKTRTTNTNLQGSQIAASNSVGIYSCDRGNTAHTAVGYGYENYLYTPDGNGALTLGNNQQAPYYPTAKAVDIYGYAPRFNTVSGFTDLQTFEVKEDQSTEANYIASDFLYGFVKNAAISTQAQNITFTHILSKVNIIIVADGTYGFSAADLSGATVTLNNIITSGGISLATGSCTQQSSSINAIKVMTIAKDNTSESVSGSAIIIPHTFPNTSFGTAPDVPLVTITLADAKTVYTYKPDAQITFASATQYNFTITMKNSGLSVSSSITPWSSSTGVSGDATKQ